jgi:hypothetical protein
MPGSLKDQNRRKLLGAALANVVAYIVASRLSSGSQWDAAALFQIAQSTATASLAALAVGVLDAQVSPITKARLVFLKWHNPLPGSRAFSEFARADPRVNLHKLRAKYGPLPRTPSSQNRLWYSIFKSVEADLSVSGAHREYLLMRDYAFMALAILVIGSVAAAIEFASPLTISAYIAILVLQVAVTLRAANTNGKCLVATVLALKSSQL